MLRITASFFPAGRQHDQRLCKLIAGCELLSEGATSSGLGCKLLACVSGEHGICHQGLYRLRACVCVIGITFMILLKDDARHRIVVTK